MVGLLLLSTALVWHDLGTREVLGRDENATITKLDQPNLQAVLEATYMKVTGQPGNMQPLYFLLQYASWPLIERNAFVFRFLPAVIGLLGVALTYKLGEALWSREAGLVGALLTALLPLQVRYAQIARPYSLLAALSLASAYFLVQGIRTNRTRHWAGFAIAATLNFYNHFNSLFVLAAEGLAAGIWWLVMLLKVLKKREPVGRLVGPAAAFLAVGILCAPGLLRLVGLPWVGLDGEGEPGAAVAVELTLPFLCAFLYKAGLTTSGLQLAVVALMLVGLAAALYRREWFPLLLTLFWLALPFAVLSLAKSPRPFVERYLIFVPPVALLLAGRGLVFSGEWAGALGRRRAARWVATAALAAGLALLFVTPLRTYYAQNRAVDRLDRTLEVVERNARPGDLVLISPRFLVRPLSVKGAEIRYLAEHPTPAELEDLAGRSGRIWILYTSYLPAPELQEPLDPWVQDRAEALSRVPIKAITALAFGDLAPADAEADLQERIAVLAQLAEVSADRQEAWLRHEALAAAYESLAGAYDSRGEPDLAAEARVHAEEAREAAPRPW
jgi:4-amino-4-deoxy-L-arabinose transferase-like glycosyltransferase